MLILWIRITFDSQITALLVMEHKRSSIVYSSVEVRNSFLDVVGLLLLCFPGSVRESSVSWMANPFLKVTKDYKVHDLSVNPFVHL